MQSFQMQAKTFPNLTLNDILVTSIVKIRHMSKVARWRFVLHFLSCKRNK